MNDATRAAIDRRCGDPDGAAAGRRFVLVGLLVGFAASGCAPHPKLPDRCPMPSVERRVAVGAAAGMIAGGLVGAATGAAVSYAVHHDDLADLVLDEDGRCRYGEDGWGRCFCGDPMAPVYAPGYADQLQWPAEPAGARE
jgi:hypothetical protein